MSLLSVLFLLIIYSQSGISINSTMINEIENSGSHSALDLMLCTREVSSNITCPAGKYATSKCVCATCLDFGDVCTVDSQCCQSAHMSCWKFTGLSGAHCLCDDSYTWDAYTATCFMPANLPQQMLMITLYSFISMFVFVGILFTLAHVCNFSICGTLKPRNNDFETGDLNFLQETETRSNRDMPPSYSQIFPEFCPQDAMVNAGLDLALPLYSQAMAQQHNRQTQEEGPELIEQHNISEQRQFTLHQNQIQIEPPPAYEEADPSQITHFYSLHPIVLPEINDNLHDNSNEILQVPTIIVTPSENLEDNETQFTDDPDLDTPPAALLQVPNRSELESVNIESPPKNTSTLLVELNKPVFVTTMNIMLENPLFHIEDETLENTYNRDLDPNLNTDSNDNCLHEYQQHPIFKPSQYLKHCESFSESVGENHDDRKKHDLLNARSIEMRCDNRELISKKIEIPILPTIIEEPNNEICLDNCEIQFFQEENLNEENNIPSTSKTDKCFSLKETYKNGSSNSLKNDVSDSLSQKLFKFDYNKFYNFQRSVHERSENVSFQPSNVEDNSSYTSPACQM